MPMNLDMPDNVDTQDSLFEVEDTPLPVSLADRFLVPPFSVLDRRSGDWQERKRRWLSMGMRSELGRSEGLLVSSTQFLKAKIEDIGTTSVFDPVLCEVAYRWYSKQGDRVLDPFAGGSVRGLVASALARWYTGIDLRLEQVEANRQQAHLGSDIEPSWVQGDATMLDWYVDGDFDFVFTCPPYAYLEVYSDDPADLSNMDYNAFLRATADVWAGQYEQLRPDRFAVWVISDVRRAKDGGAYEGLVADTIKQAQAAGFELYNDHVVIDPVGTLMLRAPRWFESTRKVGRSHQHMLVFVKGDPRKAAKRVIGHE